MNVSFARQEDTPTARDLVAERLKSMESGLAARNTTAQFMARGISVVFEPYAQHWHGNKRHHTASLTQALVGSLGLTKAMDDDQVNPNDSAPRLIPQWCDEPQKSTITVWHLATQTSGIEDAESSDQEISNASGKGLSVDDCTMHQFFAGSDHFAVCLATLTLPQ